jgi:membrane protease YdiL (CAAX protease family)
VVESSGLENRRTGNRTVGSNPTSSASFLSIARVLLFLIACAVVLAFTAPVAGRLSGHQSELFLGTFTSVATFVLTAIFVRWEGLRLADAGARLNAGSLGRLALGFLIGSLIIAAWAVISLAAGQVHWVRANDADPRSIAIALLAYLSLACREELAFRGYPLRVLDRRFGLWIAQLFIAVMFALEHKLAGATWLDAFLGAGVGSLLFGMAAIATRGLAIPIGIHTAWNLGHWALGMKGSPGVWRAVVDEQHRRGAGFAAMFIYDAIMLSAAVAFWLWHTRFAKRTTDLAPN